jgi:hypothetical protein
MLKSVLVAGVVGFAKGFVVAVPATVVVQCLVTAFGCESLAFVQPPLLYYGMKSMWS